MYQKIKDKTTNQNKQTNTPKPNRNRDGSTKGISTQVLYKLCGTNLLKNQKLLRRIKVIEMPSVGAQFDNNHSGLSPDPR